MKSGTLTIGATGVDKVKVGFDEPETIDELIACAKKSDEVILRGANRGRRIEHQERSGARDWLKEHQNDDADAKLASLTQIVADYDPTVVKERKAPTRKPKTVTLPKGKKKYDPAELAELLKAQGIQVDFGGAEEEAAATE